MIQEIYIKDPGNSTVKYLSKLKKFNNTLLASSSLLEDYIDSKVSI